MSQTITNPRLVKLQDTEQAWSFFEDTKVRIKTHRWLYFEIGARLKAIRDNKIYKQLGDYKSFDEFIEESDVGFKRRTAYNYIEIYEYFFLKLSMQESDVINTPYYRLIEIKRYFSDKPDEEVKEMVVSQEHMPAFEFKRMKKDRGAKDTAPKMFQNQSGKWTIEFDPDFVHRITNIKTTQDIYHE